MAKSKNNVVTHGLSGKVGDILVFSQRAGKTIVGKVPRKRSTQPTAAQKQQLQRFQQAVIYAKGVMANAVQKAAYKASAKAGESAYNIAVADMLHAPNIESIDLSTYKGNIGDKITIIATDDFKVVQVSVTIENADGSLVEQGNAVQDAQNNLQWVYTATAANTDLTGDKITVKATDTPGNLAEMHKQTT